MRNLVWLCSIGLFLLVSCDGKRKGLDPFSSLTNMVDSVKSADTLVVEPPVEEEPQPMRADESFDDFLLSYASDSILQRRRTVFPLPYYKGETATKIEKTAWVHDRTFSQVSYYTSLYDSEGDMDIVSGDSVSSSVQIEFVYLRKRDVKKYYFQRNKGAWVLEAINERTMSEDENGGFVAFYARFAEDSIYQVQHITNPLQYVTTDPDDNFSILETTLDREQWNAFKPTGFPVEMLVNINYGQKNEERSATKVLKVSGVDNDVSVIFYFKKIKGQWMLYKFEDTNI